MLAEMRLSPSPWKTPTISSARFFSSKRSEIKQSDCAISSPQVASVSVKSFISLGVCVNRFPRTLVLCWAIASNLRNARVFPESRLSCFVSGHDFSRAAQCPTRIRALAPGLFVGLEFETHLLCSLLSHLSAMNYRRMTCLRGLTRLRKTDGPGRR